MASKNSISHAEIWDDTILVDSWNEALEEYKVWSEIGTNAGLKLTCNRDTIASKLRERMRKKSCGQRRRLIPRCESGLVNSMRHMSAYGFLEPMFPFLRRGNLLSLAPAINVPRGRPPENQLIMTQSQVQGVLL
jgi:hypothetical protein